MHLQHHPKGEARWLEVAGKRKKRILGGAPLIEAVFPKSVPEGVKFRNTTLLATETGI